MIGPKAPIRALHANRLIKHQSPFRDFMDDLTRNLEEHCHEVGL
jgi:hypothetical protein